MAFLLDTNIAIGLGDGRPDIRDRLMALNDIQLFSIITVVELHGGLTGVRDRAAERRRTLARILPLFDVLPLTVAVADAYAGIVDQTGFSRPRILDRLIAATALVHGLTVITTNGPDFAAIPGLRLEVWPRPVQ